MKKKIEEEIFSKDYDGVDARVPFSDLPKDIRNDDFIVIRSEESYFSENNSYDGYTRLTVIREREETDEEYEKRTRENKLFKEELKARRYETYLKLKKEFEK